MGAGAMKTTSHSEGALIWVDEQMKTLGVDDYHFAQRTIVMFVIATGTSIQFVTDSIPRQEI